MKQHFKRMRERAGLKPRQLMYIIKEHYKDHARIEQDRIFRVEERDGGHYWFCRRYEHECDLLNSKSIIKLMDSAVQALDTDDEIFDWDDWIEDSKKALEKLENDLKNTRR